MVIMGGPFLGETNNCGGKDDADDDTDDVAEERYEEANPLGVVFYNLCGVIAHLYATPSCGEEYPRPQQQDQDATQQAHVVGSGAKSCGSSRIGN